MPPPGIPSAMTLKRINREVADLKKEDLGNIILGPTEDNLHVWRGTIPGPEGSVYEGGVFHVEINLPADYPFSAPRVAFKTRIYHMNISETGSICIDILKSNWSPALSLFKVMLSISSLLTDPNPKDPLVPTVANQYTRNRKQHDTTAREWTALYAKPKPLPSSIVTAPKPIAQSSRSASTSVMSLQHSIPEASRERSGRRGPAAVAALRRAGSSAASSQATTPVIVIDDGAGSSTSSGSSNSNGRGTNAGGKRKREVQGRSPAEIVDLIAEEEAETYQSAPGSSSKRRRTSHNSSSHPNSSGRDVIVVEDD